MTLVNPANNNNAIKIAAFAFELIPESITHEILVNIQNNYQDKLYTFYNNIATHNETVVTFTESGRQISDNPLGSLSLFNVDSTGNKTWEIAFNKNNIIVTCYSYTRWDEVFKKAKDAIKEILNSIEKTLLIRSLTLEYVDEFTILNNSNNLWKKELFKNDTNYLPRNILELTNPWHSHHGFFVEGSAELNPRILINLNIEYVVNPVNGKDVYKLIIRSQHRSLPNSITEFNSGNVDTVIHKAMDENHEINKNLLRDLLTSEALDSIQLGESNA